MQIIKIKIKRKTLKHMMKECEEIRETDVEKAEMIKK